jgi:hypothetical protein
MSTKYIEELKAGDAFTVMMTEEDSVENNQPKYVLSCDFKSNGQRMCISLIDGTSRWLDPNCVVLVHELYTMDKENCIIAVKETKKDDINKD